jgi:hypothetical protein
MACADNGRQADPCALYQRGNGRPNVQRQIRPNRTSLNRVVPEESEKLGAYS